MIYSKNLISINEPNSYITESYKMLRTNINYLNIDGKNKVLMMTSPISENGKTTTISNLAITMANDGKKVLLVEGDLRRPRIHELFKINQTPGLTNLIIDDICLSKVISKANNIDRLDIITSGTIPLSAPELLNSQAFKSFLAQVRDSYDIVLIDTPPVLSVTDATIISQLVDGVIIVAAAKETKKSVLIKMHQALRQVHANIIGVVITKMNRENSNYNDAYYKADSHSNKFKYLKKKFLK